MGLLDIVPAGVITGDDVRKLFNYGKFYNKSYREVFIIGNHLLLYSS
jgi:hypothetical protein